MSSVVATVQSHEKNIMQTILKTRIKLAVLLLLILQLIFFGITKAQTKQTIDTGDFHSIYVNSDYNVTIRQSNTTEVKAEADPEIWNMTNIWVDNGVLYIDVNLKDTGKKNLLNKIENKLTKTMEVSITVQKLDEIIHNGGGRVTAENSITASNFKIQVNGNGSVDMDLRADKADVSIFSQGKVTLSGYGDELTLEVAGDGDYSGLNFDVKNAKATIRGNGTKAQMNVSTKLSVFLYGNAEVFYKGKVKDITKKVYGNGHVLFRG